MRSEITKRIMERTPESTKEKVEMYARRRVEFCKQLSKIAKDKRISQQKLADMCDMKQSSINRVLNAKFTPTLDMLMKIADALDVEIKIV